jgi:hypothetical protein
LKNDLKREKEKNEWMRVRKERKKKRKKRRKRDQFEFVKNGFRVFYTFVHIFDKSFESSEEWQEFNNGLINDFVLNFQ